MPSTRRTQILAAIDENIERMRTEPVTQDELDRARRKIRSELYDLVGSSTTTRAGRSARVLRAVR